ncbi:hypothetical protein I79_020751 [Cricetulus griseus]|uniref:Uncharacterized protein n=1 Tax=Cricetulus griseus TaxID=10029 RepID=G3IAW9_CRIGR|nr:hypothetical protein I79_020751 [Cricetulus griseus]
MILGKGRRVGMRRTGEVKCGEGRRGYHPLCPPKVSEATQLHGKCYLGSLLWFPHLNSTLFKSSSTSFRTNGGLREMSGM